MNKQFDILIVDDEDDIRGLIQGILEDEGYKTRGADGSESAYARLAEKRPDLVILDIWLQGSTDDGIKILERIVAEHPDVPVIMISGHGTIETAVSAIKLGAYDFIEKPFKTDRLILMIQRALETAVLKQENMALRARAENIKDQMLDSSPISQQILQILDRAAPTNSRILITGETGTGKNLAARYLHAHSKRESKPFMALNCASLHPERLEVELFGSVEGILNEPAKAGLLELADGGTLLLDEVVNTPIEIQGKLLRALQDNVFQKVGASANQAMDVRVIATTSVDIEKAMNEGVFRRDLYYRLNVVQIQMPALRHQRADIPLLIERLCKQISKENNMLFKPLSQKAMFVLQGYGWPGNMRQLRNVLEWVAIMSPSSDKEQIEVEDLPPEITGLSPKNTNEDAGDASYLVSSIFDLTLREAREHFERDYLLEQVKRFGGNVSKTAQFIGMERSALHRKLKMLEVSVQEEAVSTTDKPKISAQSGR